MAYNLLSGTVVANENVVIQPPDDDGANIVEGKFIGDGQQLQNVARIVANGTTDFMVTVGANADSLVGEPNLQFNGSRLLVNGNITASALQLTSLLPGTATTSSYLALDSNNNVILTSSSGAGGGTTTIGDAEEGSYSDGLFTDFTNSTAIGTAVDRFNEILKALSPSPAPTLDDIGCNDTGTSAKLSFGSSQNISGYTNSNTNAGFSAVDINGTYSSTTSGNNLRRAVFGGSTTIDGRLNDDVSADGSNHPSDSFGDANQGVLVLEVNGVEIHSVGLTLSLIHI